MNIRHYMALYDEAEWSMVHYVGFTPQLFEQNFGIFDLEHHIKYLKEVNIGDNIAIYFRFLGLSRSKKRLHAILYMVNETNKALASTLETLCTCSDLKARRTVAFPQHIAEKLTERIEQHNKLEWRPQLCGAIAVEPQHASL